ncbi:DUF2976 domain-containing protein [Motilimonas cestriensis]|uniref:DUF2976 domain-containing protein n=1 Tax=Motilimonas cestriensis TaxID=2742685 RepID=UPI003DA33AFF
MLKIASKKVGNVGKYVAGGLLLSMVSAKSYAEGLVSNLDVTEKVKEYMGETIGIVLLSLCVVGFAVTVKNCIGAYSEIQDGKGTWGALGMHVIVGGLILTFSIYLLGQADGVFGTAPATP